MLHELLSDVMLLNHPDAVRGLVAAFQALPAGQRLYGLLAGNALLSALCALVFVLLLPRTHRRHAPAAWLFFTLLGSAAPVLGLAGGAVIALGLTRAPLRELPPEPRRVEIPPFSKEMGARRARFGAGGTWATLRCESGPVDRGTRALFAADATLCRQAAALTRAALNHPREDLRLLAYSLLNQREADLSNTIDGARRLLQDLPRGRDRSEGEKRLAFLYWELVYQDLVRDDMHRYALEQAEKYAAQARHSLPADPSLLVLRGRIAMMRGDYRQAHDHFRAAITRKGVHSTILPYLAECCFQRRDFVELRLALRRFAPLRDLPTVGPVARFWAKSS